MTYKEIRKNEEVRAYLKKGNENLGVLGYTDHSEVHCVLVAEHAAYILKKLDYTERDIELAKIAGILHDIGNAINRKQHAEYGALLAGEILKKTDMSLEDRVTVMSAIGHHDESAGGATDVISAALIIAALGAKGETCIRRTEFISRGYEHICEDLEALGCRIWQSSGKGNERI